MTFASGSGLDPRCVEIAQAVRDAGGRALVVGGWARDHLLGVRSKDVDIEVFGLDVERLEALLAGFGSVHAVGRAFGVLRVGGIDVDFSLPRRDSKRGRGHRGFDVAPDPTLDFAEAARRRDLTVNSIGIDPLTGELLDPHGGRQDLERRVLRATDPARFPEDPLRGLRVAQLAARLEMAPDAELVDLCRTLDLSELSGERVFDEIRKLLLRAAKPSIGFRVLEDTGLLRFFPELDALRGVLQDPKWHPEGDVWVHTLMVLDAAASLRDVGERDISTEDGSENLALMLGALCHDLGKPATTEWDGGRIRSYRHDVEGVAPTRALLARMRVPRALVDKVVALAEHHLAPALFIRNGATAKGYRRLARNLARAGVSIALLVRVARGGPPRAHHRRCRRRPLRRRRRVPRRGSHPQRRTRRTTRCGAWQAPHRTRHAARAGVCSDPRTVPRDSGRDGLDGPGAHPRPRAGRPLTAAPAAAVWPNVETAVRLA